MPTAESSSSPEPRSELADYFDRLDTAFRRCRRTPRRRRRSVGFPIPGDRRRERPRLVRIEGDEPARGEPWDLPAPPADMLAGRLAVVAVPSPPAVAEPDVRIGPRRAAVRRPRRRSGRSLASSTLRRCRSTRRAAVAESLPTTRSRRSRADRGAAIAPSRSRRRRASAPIETRPSSRCEPSAAPAAIAAAPPALELRCRIRRRCRRWPTRSPRCSPPSRATQLSADAHALARCSRQSGAAGRGQRGADRKRDPPRARAPLRHASCATRSADIVSTIAERLVREEIERIKAAIK